MERGRTLIVVLLWMDHFIPSNFLNLWNVQTIKKISIYSKETENGSPHFNWISFEDNNLYLTWHWRFSFLSFKPASIQQLQFQLLCQNTLLKSTVFHFIIRQITQNICGKEQPNWKSSRINYLLRHLFDLVQYIWFGWNTYLCIIYNKS